MLAAAKGGTAQCYGKYCAPLVIFANLVTEATIFNYGQQVVAGGLMGYGELLLDNYVRLASYVDKIFQGAKPGDLAIPAADEVPSRGALGLTIPQELLIRAGEVIE